MSVTPDAAWLDENQDRLDSFANQYADCYAGWARVVREGTDDVDRVLDQAVELAAMRDELRSLREQLAASAARFEIES
jgi:hypothetical protein